MGEEERKNVYGTFTYVLALPQYLRWLPVIGLYVRKKKEARRIVIHKGSKIVT